MKKLNIFTIILLFISVNAIAQKQVRDSIKAGNKAYQQQLLGTAESNYKAAIQQNPTATHYKQGKWDEALKGYQHYLTLETQDPQKVGSALHNMGNTFLKKKDLQKSLEAYKESLRANPMNEKTRYNLAVVKKMLDDQNKDKDQNKQDQQQNKDKNQDQQDQQQNQNQQNQNKDQKPEKQENESMSESNAKQILQAIEQDEKETQERVKQMKAREQQKKNDENKKQDKDW